MIPFLLVLFLLGLPGAGMPGRDVWAGKVTMESKDISEVLKEHTGRLLAIPGVVGTAQGVCRGRPCLRVYVIKKTPALLERIPQTIEGIPVDIVETGAFRAIPPEK